MPYTNKSHMREKRLTNDAALSGEHAEVILQSAPSIRVDRHEICA